MTGRTTRGSLLSFIIVVGAILLIGVAAMFSSVNMTIASGEKFYRQEEAIEAARSTIHLTVAKFKAGDLEFREDLSYSPSETSVGNLTFNKDSGLPYSTNNLTNGVSVLGWGGAQVGPKSAHLVAIGEVGDDKHVLQIWVRQEAFPWSVASNGTIQGNDMEVFAVEAVSESDGTYEDGEKLRSDIVSNGGTGGDSIVLSGNSEIAGDAKAVAGISLQDTSSVKGKVEANSDRTTITLDKRAEDYRPPTGESIIFNPSSTDPLTGRYEATGDTVIGDLKFEDGMLFIDGDVTVTGDISGIGALVATGNIRVTGSMNTKADLAALVAGGDIEIAGVGPNTSTFRGLILAEGSFKAKDTTLVGSALTLDQNGSVELERVRSVAAKDLTEVDLNYAVLLKKAIVSSQMINHSSGNKVGAAFGSEFVELTDANYTQLVALAESARQAGGLAKVEARDQDGNTLASPPPEALFVYDDIVSNWDSYQQEVVTSTVEYEELFQLDFNKFLKAKGGFRPLHQKASPL